MDYSSIIVGCMRWGSWGRNFGVTEATNMIDACLQENLYTFDHADIYGGYTTERLFGEALAEMKIPRDTYQLISKCGIEYPGGEKPFELKSYNYSKEYILKCVDESLQNLKTDYLDLLLLHRPSPLMDPQEIAAAFGILRSNGKVRNFGVSNFTVSQFDLLAHYFPFLVTNQIEISLNKLDAFYDGTLDQLMVRKLRPMAYSVMGNYFSEQHSEQNKRIKKALNPLCENYSADENQLMLAFLMKHPSRIRPVVGSTNPETIKKLAKSSEIKLDMTDWFRILEAAQGQRVS